ncbi:MAG: type II and III secretion system protein family protein [Azospirillaceae bacterium]
MFSALRTLFVAAAVALVLVPLAAAPAPALEFPGAPTRTVPLEVSQGRLVRLDQPAGSVFIADPAVADVEAMSPQLIYVFGRQAGVTNLFAVGDDDQVVASLQISVGADVDDGLAAGTDVSAESVGNRVVVSGTVPDARTASDALNRARAAVASPEQVENRLQVAETGQVNLRVRIAEVQRTLVRQLGINWDAVASPGNFTFGLATALNPVALGGNFISSGGAGNTLAGGFANGNVDINVLLDALEEEGFVAILAEPNLTALSGETASFLAGGEFPVPVAQDNDSLTIEFKEFGVSLAFTPTVVNDGRINMRVRPEVSQLSTDGAIELNGITIPALTTRRAETTVDLASGQSFAIAGLFQSNISQGDDSIPVMKNLPVLGPLFRSRRFQRQETELVIIVTPYMVRPVSDDSLSLPTDKISDREPGSAAITAFADNARSAGATGGFILK